jgi:polysaccharide deacetylase family protein (PEP-CTERM system associated)
LFSGETDKNMNIITFDVEDWYHCLDPEPANWHGYEDRIVSSVRQLLRILHAADTKATFFVLGHVAELHPELVLEIHRAGHEIASHGFNHKFVYRQSPEEFEADVSQSLTLLSSIIGEPILGYRAPYFSVTKKSLWALPILQKLGLKYDSSIFPVHNHRYGIPDASRLPFKITDELTELPLSTYPIRKFNVPYAGGVYFRFFPYKVFRSMLRELNKRNEPGIFYLHPWELDAGQPRSVAETIPFTLKFRHYWALDKTAEKLTRLLQDFRFGSVREVMNL